MAETNPGYSEALSSQTKPRTFNFFSLQADSTDSDSETDEQVTLVSTTAKSRNADLLAKEKAALESIINTERETIRSMLKERAELTERLSTAVSEVTTLRRELDKKDRLVDDLQFELRRVIARQQKSDSDYYRDDAKVRVAERVREFEAHLAAIKVLQERRIASGTRARASGSGGDNEDDDELEAMRKQLVATRELLNEFQLRFDGQHGDESHLQRQLASRNDEIENLTRELADVQDDLNTVKREAARKEQRYLGLIHRLHTKLKRQIASIRDAAYLNPKSNLPRFFDEMPNLNTSSSAIDESDATGANGHALTSIKTRLIQKGVLTKLTVTSQGKTLRPRHYFALFVDDTDGVTLRWGSQESPYEGYSHSANVTNIMSGASAVAQLRAGTVGGEHGQTVASLLFPEEESRLLLISIENSTKKLFLIAGSSAACATWQAYCNQALAMKAQLQFSATSLCPLAESVATASSPLTPVSEMPKATSTPTPTTPSEETLPVNSAIASPDQPGRQSAEQPEANAEASLPAQEQVRVEVQDQGDSRERTHTVVSSRRSAYSIRDHALATAAAMEVLEQSRAAFADETEENPEVNSQAAPTEDTTSIQSQSRSVANANLIHENVVPADVVNVTEATEVTGVTGVTEVASSSQAPDTVTSVPVESESKAEPQPETQPAQSEDSAEQVNNVDVAKDVSVTSESTAPEPLKNPEVPALPARKQTVATPTISELLDPTSPDAPSTESKSSSELARLEVAFRDSPAALECEVSFPLMASLVKFTHNGKDKHVKFFCLENDGKIMWGDGPKKYRYTESVTKVYRGAGSGFASKMKPEELAFLFTIETSGKDLNLLAPSQEIMDVWVSAVEYLVASRP